MTPEQRKAQFVAWGGLLASTVVFTVMGFVLPDIVNINLTDQLIRPTAISFMVIAVLMAAAAHALHRHVASGYSGPLNLQMLVWVFDEGLATFGLVLALMGLPPTDWLLFNVVSAVLLVMHRPRADQPGPD